MPQITKLKTQKRSQRVNVYLDGEYTTSLELATAVKLRLKVGMDISQAHLRKLVKTHKFEKLLNKAVHFLSYRPRSEKEVRDHLRRKRRADTTKTQHEKNIDEVIDKLKRQGLINDQEFVNWWITQRLEYRPRGRRLLKLELRQKGISLDLLNEALAKLDDYEPALRIANKKMRSLKGLEIDKLHIKLTSFLQRRGFTWQTIKRVVDELKFQE